MLLLWIVIGLLFLAGTVVTLINALARIPDVHRGVRYRLGEQLPGSYDEGLRTKVPFIDEMQCFSLEPVIMDIEAEFTSNDSERGGLSMVVIGLLEYHADERILDGEDRCVFVRVPEKTRRATLLKNIEARLGKLGGAYKGLDFRTERAAIEDIINIHLRLRTPPHLCHEQNNQNQCGLANCPDKFRDEVEIKDMFEFYRLHRQWVRQVLSDEENLLDDRSDLEKRNGVDIIKFSLSRVVYSKEAQADFEAQTRAEALLGVLDSKLEKAEKIQDRLKASAQVAWNAVEGSMNERAKRDIVSVEGDVGVLGGVVAGFTRGGK